MKRTAIAFFGLLALVFTSAVRGTGDAIGPDVRGVTGHDLFAREDPPTGAVDTTEAGGGGVDPAPVDTTEAGGGGVDPAPVDTTEAGGGGVDPAPVDTTEAGGGGVDPA
eukprot:Selendium_serpulae@DN6389_c1_g1_i2.p3